MGGRLTTAGLVAASLAASLTVVAQQGDEQLPRFRGGVNLVRVDAYFTKDGQSVTDLTANDVEVFEDDLPQKIEEFRLVNAQTAAPSSQAEPTNVGDMRDAAASSTRLFTLFFDTYNTSLRGSYRAQAPVVALLDKVVGPDDMVGVMTPDISPGNITYARRTAGIEQYVKETWTWGQRDRVVTTDPRDDEIRSCYPAVSGGPGDNGIAEEMIARRHEQKTLDALDNLITHLDGLRPERKFVVVFTDGWRLFQRDENLARPLGNQRPTGDPITVGPGGRLQAGPDPRDGTSSTMASCERERVMLAYIDHSITLREMAQRANRANVSFYLVDARGLEVFDSDPRTDIAPSVDSARLRDRHEAMRTLAIQTDGAAVVDTNNTARELEKLFVDTGTYYLISYYSSNNKLDGRFRRIGVRAKRDGVEVRARPGYLAPTESEARAAGALGPSNRRSTMVIVDNGSGAPAPEVPESVARALDAIAPARGNLPVRVQASGGQGMIRAVVELDANTLKQPEWSAGADLRVDLTPERGGENAQQTMTGEFNPGQRSVELTGPAGPLSPGRYSVRAVVRARGVRMPLQATTFVTVPPIDEPIGSGALALRRGPSTGLAYLPTADPRFRRTERIRIELPLGAEGYTPTAKLLNREGVATPLVVTYSTRVDDESKMRLGVAEVNLAPLAPAEYVLQVTLQKDGRTEEVTYGFQIVP